MQAGVTDQLWNVSDLVTLLEAEENETERAAQLRRLIIMDYLEELKGIPGLAAIGEALVEYAKSLFPGASFTNKKRRWVCKPNFVAFTIQAVRAKNIRFEVYGVRYEFEKYSALPLYMARSSYREFIVEKPGHLGPAANYIAQAARAYAKRHHDQESVKRIEAILMPIKRTPISK
jgi:hypothetical protein